MILPPTPLGRRAGLLAMSLLAGLTIGGLTGLAQLPASTVPEKPSSGSSANARVIDLAAGGDVMLAGAPRKEQLGNDMAVGDLNGDGVADLVTGAHWWTTGGRNIIGRSYALFGRESWPAMLDLSRAANRDWSLTGRGLEARLGSSVATGDIDDDGIDDWIVASVLADPVNPEDPGKLLANAGAIYIMLGGEGVGGDVDFLDDEPDIYIAGRSSSIEADRLGTYLVTGDWNGDGRTDLAASAAFREGFTGRVYGWWGPLREGERIELQIEEPDFTIDGDVTSGFFGAAMASGDVDDDGFEDLAIVALGSSAGPSGSGAVHVFRGGPGFGQPERASDAATTILGRDGMGLGSALSAGGCSCRGQVLAIDDLTGDGRLDLLVGASLDDAPGASNAGSAVVLAGPVLTGTHALDSTPHLSIRATKAGERFGWTVAPGNLNRDGQADLVVAAPYADADGRSRAGLVYGWTGPLPATGVISASAQTADLLLYGPSAERGTAGMTLRLADTDGDGDDDLHVGIPDVAPLGRLSVGAIYIAQGPLLEPAPTVTPEPSPSPTSTATPQPTATLASSPTSQPSPSVTARPSASARPEPSPTLQPSPSPLPSPTPLATTAPHAAWLPVLLLLR